MESANKLRNEPPLKEKRKMTPPKTNDALEKCTDK